jgi:thiol:disulfide interchange protein
MTMISAAVCIGALLVLAWVGLMAAAGLSLIGLGLQPALVLLLLAALTLALALTLRGYLRHRSRYLGFPATLRSLKPPPSGTQQGETG